MTSPNKLGGARIGVLALVSGLPRDKRGRRRLIMLQAFIDESFESRDLFVMAGYIAPVEKWLLLSDEWERLLSMNSPHYRRLDAFKMSEMKSNDRCLEQASWFYKVIEQHVDATISCTINVEELERSVKEFPWPSWVIDPQKLANPYYVAFKNITVGLAQVQSHMGINEPVDFVFDENSNKSKCLDGWDLMRDSVTPDVRQQMGSTPIFRNDKEALPLQAADLYAHWVRQWAIDGDADGVAHLKLPWKIERDIPRLDMRFSYSDFWTEWERGVAVHLLRMAGLESASSIFPSQVVIINH